MRKYQLLLVALAFSFSALSQNAEESNSKPGLLKKMKLDKAVSNVLEGKPPISTSFRDVKTEGSMPADYGANERYRPLQSMPRNEQGAYMLPPGYYETTNLSYCLKAGTFRPDRGDAYGLAPLDGKMEDVVRAILVRSQQIWRDKAYISLDSLEKRDTRGNLAEAVMNLSQKDVQVLLWAIIARADFSDLQGRTKAVAMALLTPQELVKLNGGAVKTVTNFATDKGFVRKPPVVQMVERAEQDLRQLWKKGNATFEDFERLAVLAGLSDEPQPFERGTWFKHPDGFYVRYEPQGYPRTTVKIYVPQGMTVNYAGTGWVATPSDSRQRLAQTDLSVEEYSKLHKGLIDLIR